MSNNIIVKISAIIGLTILGSLALLKGIDSVILSAISAIIGGIAGYEIGKSKPS